MNRGGFANLIAPGYRKVLFETYKERPTEGNKVVNMGTANRAYIDDQQVGGFGTLVEKVEGGPHTFQDAVPGGTKRYTWTTYGLGFRITQEMYEDDLYGIMGNKMAKALGRSVRNNFELVAFSVLNNAFNSGFVGYTAGEALCGSHSTLRGGTIVNNAAADFGLLPFQAALEHFHNLTDESGLPIVYMPKQVVHSIGDYWMVNQVIKTPQLPGGNANDINQAAREGVKPELVHYLTDPDAWFVTADNHDMNYFDRRKPTFRTGDDMQTGDAIYIVSRRNGAGFGDWRGVYGSTGQ
jgi:hypothetical protein